MRNCEVSASILNLIRELLHGHKQSLFLGFIWFYILYEFAKILIDKSNDKKQTRKSISQSFEWLILNFPVFKVSMFFILKQDCLTLFLLTCFSNPRTPRGFSHNSKCCIQKNPKSTSNIPATRKGYYQRVSFYRLNNIGQVILSQAVCVLSVTEYCYNLI